MPKDEFDFEDPFELNGMMFLSHEDTTNDMAECFTRSSCAWVTATTKCSRTSSGRASNRSF